MVVGSARSPKRVRPITSECRRRRAHSARSIAHGRRPPAAPDPGVRQPSVTMKARDLGTRLLWTVVFVFVIGVSLGGVELIFRLLAGRGLPRWSLLTYIGAAFV